MKERPILFSATMVRALLDGRKSQTRRIVKPQPDFDTARKALGGDTSEATPIVSESPWGGGIGLRLPDKAGSNVKNQVGFVQPNIHCPYGQPGDRLWVRETWSYVGPGSGSDLPSYALERADPANHLVSNCWYLADGDREIKWTPSIHMFRWASRILLEVVSVRVERLQEISEADAVAEGANVSDHMPMKQHYDHGVMRLSHRTKYLCAREAYRDLWEQINGPGSWAANPFVWIVEFKRLP